MSLRFRQMTVTDLPAVFTLRTMTRENTMTMAELADRGVTPDSLAAAMSRSVEGWLCEDGDLVTGFSMGDRANGEVQVVAVHPDYEGRRIGKTLLAHVRDWLFASGHDEIWLMANPDPTIRAYAFYRHLGWEATGEVRDGEEVMVLRQ